MRAHLIFISIACLHNKIYRVTYNSFFKHLMRKRTYLALVSFMKIEQCTVRCAREGHIYAQQIIKQFLLFEAICKSFHPLLT